MSASRCLCLSLIMLMLSACTMGSGYTQQRISFNSAQGELFGTLVLPARGQGPFPLVIFVHGDGPLPYDAHGYYRPYWQALAEQGIAAFSWDKSGVGGSDGDWLTQSMQQRSGEVLAAINELHQHQDKVNINKIGVIGFSQAGWVLPHLADQQQRLSFMIFVSTAINWEDQGRYHRQQRLGNQQQVGESLVTQALRQQASYQEYRKMSEQHSGSDDQLLDESRYKFVSINWQADATDKLRRLRLPVLGVFGEADLNVNAQHSQQRYTEIFSAMPPGCFQVKAYPHATHSLTKAGWLNQQSPGIAMYLLFNLFGQHAFADGMLEDVSQWAADVFTRPPECNLHD